MIKRLWIEVLEFQKSYEEETMDLIENLKINLENDLKYKIKSNINNSFYSNLKDSQGNLSETLAKKDQTITILLTELEKLNNFINLKNSPKEINHLKLQLDEKAIEITSINEKNNELENALNFNNERILAQNQLIEKLTEKNNELTHKLNKKYELNKEKAKHISFKDNGTPNSQYITESNQHEHYPETSSIDFMKNDKQNMFLDNNLNGSRVEKEKASSLKRTDYNLNQNLQTKEELNEKIPENERKKYQDEIRKLKEKITNLMIERENLIWSESNFIKQLNDFQMEKKLEILKEDNKQKIFKKSKTMHVSQIYDTKSGNNIEIKEEEKLISELEEIMKLVKIL